MLSVAHLPSQETLGEHIDNKTKYKTCSSNGESETKSENETKSESEPGNALEFHIELETNNDIETILSKP